MGFEQKEGGRVGQLFVLWKGLGGLVISLVSSCILCRSHERAESLPPNQ